MTDPTRVDDETLERLRTEARAEPGFTGGTAIVEQSDLAALLSAYEALRAATGRLVVAARIVAYGDRSADEIKALDERLEDFAATFPWDDEPGGEDDEG